MASPSEGVPFFYKKVKKQALPGEVIEDLSRYNIMRDKINS